MLYTLHDLMMYASSVQTQINGQYVPARPIGRSQWGRLSAAYKVLTGRADAFTWPMGQ